jgi:hypothetical protein
MFVHSIGLLHSTKQCTVRSLSYLLLCHIVMKPEFSTQILAKTSTTKFHENPSSGSRVAPRWRTDGRTDAHTGTAKLTIAFRNSANTPEQRAMCWCAKLLSCLVNVLPTLAARCSTDRRLHLFVCGRLNVIGTIGIAANTATVQPLSLCYRTVCALRNSL